MPARPPAGALPPRSEIAVVGGGLTGLSAALHLARRGLRVDVLESGALGCGASGRTGGLALEGTAAGDLDGAGGCLEELGALCEAEGVDCGLEWTGVSELRHDPPRAAAGDGATPPGWSDEDGQHLVHDETVPGGTLEPGRLVDGLARAALAAGARLHEGAAVRRIEPEGAPRLHLEGGRSLSAEGLLVATNAFLPELLGARLAGASRLGAALTVCIATRPLPASAREALAEAAGIAGRAFYTQGRPYLWGRFALDGGLVLGGGLVRAGEAGAAGLAGIRIAEPPAAAVLARLERRARGLHPALAEMRVRARWGGPVCFRSGGFPLLAALPGAPRTIVAGAYAGHGVAFALRAGALAAAALADGAPLPAWGAPGRPGAPARAS